MRYSPKHRACVPIWGYPPLVTPLSQMVGVQATVNVLLGGRYKSIGKEIKSYIDLYEQGDGTIGERRELIYARRAAVEREMEELQKVCTLNSAAINNIAPRLRMTTLYAIGAAENRLVAYAQAARFTWATSTKWGGRCERL